MLLGKSLDYWVDLQVIMETHMIQTPEELDGRLGRKYIMPPGVLFSTEMVNRIKEVLIRSIGDTRRCPRCGHGFVLDDIASNDAEALYYTLFLSGINNTPFTDRFQEWNW